MGAYLCIARNEVPPAVSKRVNLKVNCKYFWKTVYGALLVVAIASRAPGSRELEFKIDGHVYLWFNVYSRDERRKKRRSLGSTLKRHFY